LHPEQKVEGAVFTAKDTAADQELLRALKANDTAKCCTALSQGASFETVFATRGSGEALELSKSNHSSGSKSLANELLSALLECGMDPNGQFGDSRDVPSLLFAACSANMAANVSLLVQKGANCTFSFNGNTALTACIDSMSSAGDTTDEDAAALSALLRCLSTDEVSALESQATTSALTKAIQKGLCTVSCLLVVHGSRVHVAAPGTGCTPLHAAASAGSPALVDSLVTEGRPDDVQAALCFLNAAGQTPLAAAEAAGLGADTMQELRQLLQPNT
jgi:ankyrin repeat protein